MIQKMMRFIHVNRNKLIPAAAVAVLFVMGITVLATSSKLGAEFTPDETEITQSPYENKDTKTAFDGSQTGNDGTSINKDTKEQKKLEDGNEDIQKQEKTQEEFTIAQDSTKSENGSTTPVMKKTTDGKGKKVKITTDDDSKKNSEESKNTDTKKNETGTGDSGNGDGGTGDSENGDDGSVKPTATPAPGDNSHPATPKPTATVKPNKNLVHDSDSASYGEGTSDKKADNAVEDEQFVTGTVRDVTFSKEENKTLYLYPGEQPDADKMKEVFSVSVRITSGNSTSSVDNLQYSYQNDRENYGGDYYVDWDAGTDGVQNDTSTEAGVHEAKIFVKNPVTGAISYARSNFSYTIYEYRLNLLDFDENYEENGDSRLDQTVKTVKNGRIDLQEAMAKLNTKIKERSASGKKYIHIFRTSSSGSYTSYFSGWSEHEAGSVIGNSYNLKSVEEQELQTDSEGVVFYSIDLYPQWVELDTQDSLYQINLDADGMMVLTDYEGNHSTLEVMDIPDGVARVDMQSLMKKEPYTNLKLINVPESVIEIIFPKEPEGYPALENYGVASDNLNYMDVDGILYDKTGMHLLRVPVMRTDITSWSKKITEIDPAGFEAVTMKSLKLPDTVEKIAENAFASATINELYLTGDKPPVLGKQALGTTELDAVEKIIVKDSDKDSVYLDYLIYFVDWFTKNDYTDYELLTQKILMTEAGTSRNYEYKAGWILADDGTNAVRGTTTLKEEEEIPKGVTKLETDLLQACKQVEKITLPDTVNAVEERAFDSNGLTAVYFTSEAPPTLSGSGKMFGTQIPMTTHLYVPDTKYEDYYSMWERFARRGYGAGTTDVYTLPYGEQVKTEDGCVYWEKTEGSYILLDGRDISGEYKIKEGTNQIWKYAFYGNYQLRTITFDTDVDSIGDYAFSGCRGLSSVQVNAGLGKIGQYAFESCSRLNKFIWGTIAGANKLTSIGDYAFKSCGLTGLPDTVSGSVNIGMDSILAQYPSCVIFQATCPRLRSELFTSLTYIGKGAFALNASMKNMSIPLKLSYENMGYESWNDMVKENWKSWFESSGTNAIGNAANAVSGGSSGGGDEGGDVI